MKKYIIHTKIIVSFPNEQHKILEKDFELDDIVILITHLEGKSIIYWDENEIFNICIRYDDFQKTLNRLENN